jgi:tRNA(Glu) U13 pseudouridine synthase TruD
MIEVTEENKGQYALEDVIMPLIGHKVKMPSNPEMKQLYETIMAEDQMTMDKFMSHAQNVLTSASGSYRKII